MKPGFRFYLITDRKLCPNFDLLKIITQVCESGVQAIQLREKDLPARQLFHTASQVTEICHRFGCRLLINGRFDIALASNADGVHLNAQALPADIIREKIPVGQLIGVSVHSIEEAIEAERKPCDFLLFGPVFMTPSKRKYGPPQGLENLRKVTEAVEIPVFAVGGITPQKARGCIDCGAYGVAAISSIMSSPNITRTLQKYKEALGNL